MVIDMVRNDVGRIAETGSVDVPALFTLERYPNVWQMTSTVTARATAPLDEIFAAMFPSAPVTDVILWNANGEVTESTIANVVVEINGRKVTPPVECGLLAGTFRAELLATCQVTEAPVTVDRLHTAARFWLVNSVRGWCRAVLARD